MQRALASLLVSLALLAAGTISGPAQTNPILYCTQVPVSGFVVRSSAFGNHDPSIDSAPRGGDLMIRYPDGTVRNLTQEAGLGTTGFQGANAIAVREPCVHWSGTKALFSMVIGAPTKQYQVTTHVWQIYEVTGFGPGETVQITKVPNQPANFNNISPVYGSDDRIIFTSDRPRNGQAHLWPQLDEYESAPTVSGVWSLNPSTGDLRLLSHSPSGAFTPIVDSFGRVVYTRWDHLQQDQQADADRGAGSPVYGSFTYSDESATAARLPLGPEVFPEPRLDNHPENVARNRSGNRFNLFMPWQINQDGTEEETLNHVGRHEFTSMYRRPSFLDDPNLSDQIDRSLHANRTFLVGGDGGLFFIREDPVTPGTYWGINAPEFFTDGAGQIVRFTGSPSLNADEMVITAITHPVTRTGRADDAPATPDHVGLFRSPLPLSDGTLVAVHSPESRFDENEGTRSHPQYRYGFRLRRLTPAGAYFVPGEALTPGTVKTLSWWDPDVQVTFSDELWELDPVEVVARPVPPMPTGDLGEPEQQVLAEEGVDEDELRAWLAENQLALIVTRNNTVRDRNDVSQPFNLRVPGGVSTTPAGGKVYDVAHLQLVQADQVRGYGGMNDPRPGRRVLGQFLHDPAATNPANPDGPPGSVRLGLDGSSAAFVPARRAMSWQLTDPNGEPVVRERNWVTFQPGEIRTCAACHGVNTAAHGNLGTPTNKPEALRDLLRFWKTLQPDDEPPPTPARFAVSTSGQTRAHLSWRAAGTETGFRIERATAPAGPFTAVASVGADAVHFTDDGLTPGNTYYYRVIAIGAQGESPPTTASAVVAGQAPTSRLLNISTRARSGDGEDTVIAGFTIAGGTPRRLLVRAVGPSLAGLNVPDPVADPVLEIFGPDGSTLGMNDDWSEPDVGTIAASVGAFSLPPGSKDAATVVDLAPGGYTVHVRATDASHGVALIEVYDASGTPGANRLVNISTRGRVSTGTAIMIPGFVISPGQPRLLLIRAVGPSLAKHGVSDVLSDPVLSVYAGSELIAQSNDWSLAANAEEIAAEAARVGAFPLDADSADAALLITLAPGAYTFHVTGANGATGVALCEVYTVE